MLPKKYRLPVQSVISSPGRSYSHRYFLIKVFPAKTAESRFGVVISAKLVPRATTRNALKRRIYGAVDAVRAQLPRREYLIIVRAPYQKDAADGMINALTTSLTSIHE